MKNIADWSILKTDPFIYSTLFFTKSQQEFLLGIWKTIEESLKEKKKTRHNENLSIHAGSCLADKERQ